MQVERAYRRRAAAHYLCCLVDRDGAATSRQVMRVGKGDFSTLWKKSKRDF
ncbi:MAG: hypothetical protein G3M70_06915 [Candidatus Nitronauta litoralis]|uniref:Uncharacterized protein n=1 Tax=Candidatus Nitronauta litoralis TaxID=2705533 RepID=A0A7T0BVB4_9BACT|nr:MAG: hypothetical protein G3M70_06915 [Candidatus Nitronauta litoralis]